MGIDCGVWSVVGHCLGDTKCFTDKRSGSHQELTNTKPTVILFKHPTLGSRSLPKPAMVSRRWVAATPRDGADKSNWWGTLIASATNLFLWETVDFPMFHRAVQLLLSQSENLCEPVAEHVRHVFRLCSFRILTPSMPPPPAQDKQSPHAKVWWLIPWLIPQCLKSRRRGVSGSDPVPAWTTLGQSTMVGVQSNVL